MALVLKPPTPLDLTAEELFFPLGLLSLVNGRLSWGV